MVSADDENNRSEVWSSSTKGHCHTDFFAETLAPGSCVVLSSDSMLTHRTLLQAGHCLCLF